MKIAIWSVFHVSQKVWNRCIGLDGNKERLRSRFFMRSQTFSVGLRSGICAGHVMCLISLLQIYSVIDLALWIPQLSSCSTKSAGPLWTLHAKGRIRFSSITPYVCRSNFPTVPTNAVHPVVDGSCVRSVYFRRILETYTTNLCWQCNDNFSQVSRNFVCGDICIVGVNLKINETVEVSMNMY